MREIVDAPSLLNMKERVDTLRMVCMQYARKQTVMLSYPVLADARIPCQRPGREKPTSVLRLPADPGDHTLQPRGHCCRSDSRLQVRKLTEVQDVMGTLTKRIAHQQRTNALVVAHRTTRVSKPCE